MIKKWAKTAGAGVLALIFPGKCLECGKYIKTGTHPEAHVHIDHSTDAPLRTCFCHTCRAHPLPVFDHPFCPACGRCLESGPDHLCEACLKTPMAMDSVRAAFMYEDVIQQAVGMFKYKSGISLARPFERSLFQAFAAHFDMDRFDLILPVPLHPSKARQRGFNQSYLLVRNFPRLYRAYRNRQMHGQQGSKQQRAVCHAPWRIEIDSLVRVQATVSQTGLDYQSRKKNLARAFACPYPGRIKGKTILLVDDVCTTGATCNAAARTLLDAGATRVSVLALARA